MATDHTVTADATSQPQNSAQEPQTANIAPAAPQTDAVAPLAAAVIATTAPITPSTTRGRHSTYGEIRGRVHLFEVYFGTKDKNGRKRRLSPATKKRRFNAYCRQMMKDYGVKINGTLKSQKAYVARYGSPTRFLKYKLNRTIDLTPEELNDNDLQWYLEIGGVMSHAELLRQQGNIGSIEDAADDGRNVRRRLNDTEPTFVEAGDAAILPPMLPSVMPSISAMPSLDHFADPVESNHNSNAAPQAPQAQKVEGVDSEYAPALRVLHAKQTLYEKEQLERKKLDMEALFGVKCSVIKELFEKLLTEQPECTGFIPFCSTANQDENGFDFWLARHADQIKSKVADVQVLIQQLAALQEETAAWKSFLRTWKWQRIFQENKFSVVWAWMAATLNIEQRSDKEEMDADEDDEDIDLEL